MDLTRKTRALSPAWARALTVTAAVLIACFISFGSHDTRLAYGFWVFESMGKDGVLVSTAVVFGIYFLLDRYARPLLRERIGAAQTALQLLLSLLFTGFSLLSKFFEMDTDTGLRLLTERLSSKLWIGLAFLGGMTLFMLVFRLIWYGSGTAGTMGDTRRAWLHRFFGRHAFRNCVLLLMLVWLPQYFILFPGLTSSDFVRALSMYFQEAGRTNQHPMIWVTILGKLTELGLKAGISWLAIPVICIVQHVLMILLVAHTVTTIRELGATVRAQALMLLFYATLPPMFMYASTVYNDTLYSAAVLLLTLELAVFLFNRPLFFARWRHPLLTAVAALGTILRYNGFYLMLVVIAAVSVYALVMLAKKRIRLRQVGAMLCLLAVPLMGGRAVQESLDQAYGARNITARAKYAMILQQVARCLSLYGDEIPEEDYQALHAVMTWSDEELAQAYDPRNSDGVKWSFNLDATQEEMAAFLRAWTHLLVRYPSTCFMATANSVYYLFSPLVSNVRYYHEQISDGLVQMIIDEKGFNLYDLIGKTDFGRDELRYDLQFCMNTLHPALPVLGLTVNQAVYTILLLGICASTLFRRDRSVLVLAMALLVTLGTTILGPAVFKHPRYTYPIMYSMPVLVFAYMRSNPRR
ncbi:MAG: DUF6020 family protein [Candidatus Ventricola sp.]